MLIFSFSFRISLSSTAFCRIWPTSLKTACTVAALGFLKKISTESTHWYFHSTRQESHKIPGSLLVTVGWNLLRQIQCSNKYQIDRLIHEDVKRVDSSNLYGTQARAVKRNYLFFWCMDPAVEPSSQKVHSSSRLCHGLFEWIHSPLSLWQARGNGWGARFQQKAHLHPHDKVYYKGEAGFFEQGPSWSVPHMVFINS